MTVLLTSIKTYVFLSPKRQDPQLPSSLLLLLLWVIAKWEIFVVGILCISRQSPSEQLTPSCVKWCHLPCCSATPPTHTHLTLVMSHPVCYTPQSDVHVWVLLMEDALCRQILCSHVACLCHRERYLYHGTLSAWMHGVCLWPVWQWQLWYSNLFLIHFHMPHSPCSSASQDTWISAQNIIAIRIIVLLLKKGDSSYKNLYEDCRRDGLTKQVWGPEFGSLAST